MTDAIQTENARTLGHFVSMRDAILALGPTLFGHTQAVPELHFGRPVLDDLLLVARNYVTRINEVIQRIDPSAEALPLAPTAPVYGGMMLTETQRRAQLMGEVAMHRRALIASERARRGIDTITVAMTAINHKLQMELPLTAEEEAIQSAFYTWDQYMDTALNAEEVHFDALSRDDTDLDAYDVTQGWPDE